MPSGSLPGTSSCLADPPKALKFLAFHDFHQVTASPVFANMTAAPVDVSQAIGDTCTRVADAHATLGDASTAIVDASTAIADSSACIGGAHWCTQQARSQEGAGGRGEALRSADLFRASSV